jgi:hypothetical protein
MTTLLMLLSQVTSPVSLTVTGFHTLAEIPPELNLSHIGGLASTDKS